MRRPVFTFDGLAWAATATVRDRPDSVLRLLRVHHHIALGADGIRLHGVHGVRLKDGLYEPVGGQRIADLRAYPHHVEQLYRHALARPPVASWSANRAIEAAAAACSAGTRVVLEVFSHRGAPRCAPALLYEALVGFASSPEDQRVEVHSGSATEALALRCGDRFAVVMPTLEAPQDAAALVPFNPA